MSIQFVIFDFWEEPLNNLICPVSSDRINENTARVNGFLVATVVALFASTRNIFLIGFLLVDFFIRAFTSLKYSPSSWLSSQVVKRLRLPYMKTDKAPKVFAARVGFLFAAATLGFFSINRKVSVAVSLVLMSFAILESVFNFCVGCLVYTYVVFPIFGKKAEKEA